MPDPVEGRSLPDRWERLGMNTPEDVIETVLRCARAVKQADPDHTVEDFDVIGVVADMVEVYARENERLHETVEEMRAELAAAEPILVAADRVREACDAVNDGRDPGRLPDWERKSALPADEAHVAPPCGRLLVGQGDETYDPLCVLPAGHTGLCKPEDGNHG